MATPHTTLLRENVMNYYLVNKSSATVHLFGGKLSLAPKGSSGDTKRLLGFARNHDSVVRLEGRNVIEVLDEAAYRGRMGKSQPAAPPAPPAAPPVAVPSDPDEVDTVDLGEESGGEEAPAAISMTEFKKLAKANQIALLEALGVSDFDDSTKSTLEQAYEEYLNA